MVYDTLKMARRLEAGSFTLEQAQALSEAIAGGMDVALATKTDLQGVKTELHNAITECGNCLIKWVVGAMAFNLFGTAGLVLGLINVVGH